MAQKKRGPTMVETMLRQQMAINRKQHERAAEQVDKLARLNTGMIATNAVAPRLGSMSGEIKAAVEDGLRQLTDGVIHRVDETTEPDGDAG